MKITLLTGGDDPNYAFPLATSLISKDIDIDFIGNDTMQDPVITSKPQINYLNFRGDQSEEAKLKDKIKRILVYYWKLIKYSVSTDSKIFHILWLNKFVYLDRTLLNLYYKLIGKKLVFTAHNINDRARDGRDNILNKFTLKFLYFIVDAIIVHTSKMKQELLENFNVDQKKVTIVPFGLNFYILKSELSCLGAKDKLKLPKACKTLLFFGRIVPYKGLDLLVFALKELKKDIDYDLKLIIAGKVDRSADQYWENTQKIIEEHNLSHMIFARTEFIPDNEIEIYFKAADVLILPYKYIYQSGPLFIAYYFGLPVIATDVGSFKDNIVDGETGLINQPDNPLDLSNKISDYFKSDMYHDLDSTRQKIMEYARKKYSWEENSKVIHDIYLNLSS